MTFPSHASDVPEGDPGHSRGVPDPTAFAPNTVVVVLDATGRIRLWSRSAQDMLGWTGKHVLGRGFDHLMDPRSLHPKARSDIITGLLSRECWNGLLPLRHRDGRPVRVQVRSSRLLDEDGRAFVHASLTEASRPGRKAADSAALESFLESNPLGVAIFDNDLRCVRANEALARLDHHPLVDHLGHSVDEVIDEPAGSLLLDLQRQVLRTGRSMTDVTLPGPGGEGFCSVSCNRLEDTEHRVIGVACTLTDVTERHRTAGENELVRQRLSLLNEVGSRVADLLDIPMIAERLAGTLAPGFSDYAGVVLLESVVTDGELPQHAPTHRTPLIQLGVAWAQHNPTVDRMLRLGQPVNVAEDSAAGEALSSGLPQLLDSPEQLRSATYRDDPKSRAALELGVHSMMMLPLRAGGVVLGLLVVHRANDSPPFDHADLGFAMKLADRASTSLDNARLYTRERAGALMLQRALMPQHIPEPPGVHIAFRYVPGSTGNEAGGDWFDVTRLAGGRVALVIGDVTGHGLRAAATMGLLRTAVRTLSVLDLPPAQLLQHIDDIATDLAHDPDEALMATCVYAVYDPSLRRCVMARAGHVPPLMIQPEPTAEGGRSVQVLDMPSGAPLGVGGVKFEEVEFDVLDGSVLALYTDGLIETRGQDISDGLKRLCSQLSQPHTSLEAACDSVLGILDPGAEQDDVALLLAQFVGLPENRRGSP
ncbi:SpoIIE family protein phosphatase [Streptomyces turgidiscabies]|uniref:PAS domain S-box-containing protein n=1 Tax=Streptomyces turgidiscabies TaxID=85558 RepID=A0ABU0RMJ5_9ACTN|nr:SpoIIE family protein phosphatase [Streptomyces turgidiscabies]MDQ0933217.1 PAS domain S-box-containing protein [Streptomyces turgidiscabies]